MADHATASLVLIAQVLGLTGSAMLSGMIFSMSYVSIRALRDVPAPTAAKVWKRIYDIGKATAPPFAVVSAVCFGYLASQASALSYQGGTLPSPRALYITAMLSMPAIVPFTLAFMAKTNARLMDKAADEKAVSDSETKQLLAKWRWLNFGRAALVLVGSVSGCLGMAR